VEEKEEGEEAERWCGWGETVPPAPPRLHQGGVGGEAFLYHIFCVWVCCKIRGLHEQGHCSRGDD
jgi:hypothetical protein